MGAGSPQVKSEIKKWEPGTTLNAKPAPQLPKAPAQAGSFSLSPAPELAGNKPAAPAQGVKTMTERAAGRMQPGGATGQVFSGQNLGPPVHGQAVGGLPAPAKAQTMVERVASRMPQGGTALSPTAPQRSVSLPGSHLFAAAPKGGVPAVKSELANKKKGKK
jgi:hypothetical protein